MSEKFFGSNYTEVRRAIDALRVIASVSGDSLRAAMQELAIELGTGDGLGERFLSGANVGLPEQEAPCHFLSGAQHDRWEALNEIVANPEADPADTEDAAEAIEREFTTPRNTPYRGPLWLTEYGVAAEAAGGLWLGAFLTAVVASSEPVVSAEIVGLEELLYAWGKVRRWRESAGRRR